MGLPMRNFCLRGPQTRESELLLLLSPMTKYSSAARVVILSASWSVVPIYGSARTSPLGCCVLKIVTCPSRTSIFSPGSPMTRLMKYFVVSLGYLKMITSPR